MLLWKINLINKKACNFERSWYFFKNWQLKFVVFPACNSLRPHSDTHPPSSDGQLCTEMIPAYICCYLLCTCLHLLLSICINPWHPQANVFICSCNSIINLKNSGHKLNYIPEIFFLICYLLQNFLYKLWDYRF